MREAGTSERQVRHSTSFSGGGGFRGGGLGGGLGELKNEPKILDGRSGFRWDGIRSTSFAAGTKVVKTSGGGLVLWTEVLLRSRGGRAADFSRKDELRGKRSWCNEALDSRRSVRRRISSSL